LNAVLLVFLASVAAHGLGSRRGGQCGDSEGPCNAKGITRANMVDSRGMDGLNGL
jgi:hypothetical protein